MFNNLTFGRVFSKKVRRRWPRCLCLVDTQRVCTGYPAVGVSVAGREVAYGQPVFVIRGLNGASRAACRQQQQQQQVKRDSSWHRNPPARCVSVAVATTIVTCTTPPPSPLPSPGQWYHRSNTRASPLATEHGFPGKRQLAARTSHRFFYYI